MDTFIAVVFDYDEKALNGAKALRHLHDSGNIIVYSAAVIGKDKDGNVSIKEGVDEGPIGTAFGLLTGAMVGLLAAPVAVAGGAVVAGVRRGVFRIQTGGRQAGYSARPSLYKPDRSSPRTAGNFCWGFGG